MGTDLLQFSIESQQYAISVGDVVEIVCAVAITRLPAAPSIVEGVVDVRGRIVPVLDMRARFRLPAREVDPSEHFILADAGSRRVAMRVDRAVGVAHVEDADIERLTTTVPGARHVAGVAKLPDGVVLIHDVAGFLSHSESETLDHALADKDRRPA